MLLFKKREPDQTHTVPMRELALPYAQTALLSERSNEELLAELRELVEAHKNARKGIIASYFAGFFLYILGIIGTLSSLPRLGSSLGVGPFCLLLVASVSMIFLGMKGSLRIGRSFFKRRRERLKAVIPALAKRGDARMLPLLLGLMDMRYSGVVMWQESRPVLLDALETLLNQLTPEQFQELSRRQVWDTLMMLYFPDGNLREVTVEMAVRCGDSRTLEALKKLRLLCSLNVTDPKSVMTRWNPVLRYFRKAGVPLATAETQDAIERTFEGLTANVEETRRNAQLLRASAPVQGLTARELVRASAPGGAVTAPGELLRPAPGADAGATIGDP